MENREIRFANWDRIAYFSANSLSEGDSVFIYNDLSLDISPILSGKAELYGTIEFERDGKFKSAPELALLRLAVVITNLSKRHICPSSMLEFEAGYLMSSCMHTNFSFVSKLNENKSPVELERIHEADSFDRLISLRPAESKLCYLYAWLDKPLQGVYNLGFFLPEELSVSDKPRDYTSTPRDLVFSMYFTFVEGFSNLPTYRARSVDYWV